MRYAMKTNPSSEMQELWSLTSSVNINTDATLAHQPSKRSALKAITKEQVDSAKEHVASLKIQDAHYDKTNRLTNVSFPTAVPKLHESGTRIVMMAFCQYL